MKNHQRWSLKMLPQIVPPMTQIQLTRGSPPKTPAKDFLKFLKLVRTRLSCSKLIQEWDLMDSIATGPSTAFMMKNPRDFSFGWEMSPLINLPSQLSLILLHSQRRLEPPLWYSSKTGTMPKKLNSWNSSQFLMLSVSVNQEWHKCWMQTDSRNGWTPMLSTRFNSELVHISWSRTTKNLQHLESLSLIALDIRKAKDKLPVEGHQNPERAWM